MYRRCKAHLLGSLIQVQVSIIRRHWRIAAGRFHIDLVAFPRFSRVQHTLGGSRNSLELVRTGSEPKHRILPFAAGPGNRGVAQLWILGGSCRPSAPPI